MEFGKTYTERKLRKLGMYIPHRWFAWRPVQLDTGNFAWLQYVTRIRYDDPFCCSMGGVCVCDCGWRYNTIR